MSKPPKLAPASLSVNVPIRELIVRKGEAVTVWLHEGDRVVQVELHVTADGEARVLLAAEHYDVVKTFAEVYE